MQRQVVVVEAVVVVVVVGGERKRARPMRERDEDGSERVAMHINRTQRACRQLKTRAHTHTMSCVLTSGAQSANQEWMSARENDPEMCRVFTRLRGPPQSEG